MDYDENPTSGMATKELIPIMAAVFKHLPDSEVVSLGEWTDGHFNARLALKVGDLRQIAKDIAAL